MANRFTDGLGGMPEREIQIGIICCSGLVRIRGMPKRPAENMLMMEFYREGDLT